VEDDDAVAEFIEQAIDTGLECRVTRAANGRDATRRLEGGDFALVISDVRMPEMNGIEFAEWVQGHAPSLMPRLVLMTGDASDSDLNLRAEQLGVHILRKPFTLAALLASCRNLLCQRPAAPLPERTETPPGRFLISGRRSRE
jgi:two-component system cell cycle response regulator CpdR